MTNRIPPSLNWLIVTRAILAGELEKTKRSLALAKTYISELEEIEEKIRALDIAFQLHEIQIDLSLIKPIESKNYRLDIPHGELTKSILLCLELYGNDQPVSKSDIINFVIIRHFNKCSDIEIPREQLAESVRNRLKCLYRDGLIIRHHEPETNVEGVWSLKK